MPAKKAARTTPTAPRARRRPVDSLPFDSIHLEGSLFVPAELEKVTRGQGSHQSEADYRIPKGLRLDDEISRAFRIATAEYAEFHQRLDIEATRRFVTTLLKSCLGYEDFSLLTAPITLHDLSYPITAQASAGTLPIVIAAAGVGLDESSLSFGIQGSGSRKRTPGQLAQQYINAEPRAAWAIITNGHALRLIRDSDSLTQPRFLEFNLAAILHPDTQGGRFADFRALWRILHATRATVSAANGCVWEEWRKAGLDLGSRVRESLRTSVESALITLGSGFISHPANQALRDALLQQRLSKDDLFNQLLRLIYRWLFLFCAEERNLLHPPSSSPEHRKLYESGYSLRRLRSRCLRRAAADAHTDLWAAMTVAFRALAAGEPRLALPALGGLFALHQCPDLDTAQLSNGALLEAMRQLRWSRATGPLSAVDYRNMGPEELGSIYESLLELVPSLDLTTRRFGFVGLTEEGSTSGNARKTTGSYYTPDSLVQELIKSALDPVIADRLAAQPDRPIDALLSITVCDPSCGSGHFLLAAARRLAEKLAELRAPDGGVRPDDYRHALREVASRCLYGVDINPMAVELCRVALWLETVDPGKPLGFLNHHIRTGNSLLGTTPDLIAAGLPDDTFTAIEGDDKTACAELKKRNKKEREGFGPLFEQEEQTIRDRLRHAATQIEAMDDSQPAALQEKEAAFTTSETAPEYRHAKLLADLWCAAFVIKKNYPVAAGESEISNPQSQIAQPIEGQLLHTQDELFGQPPPAPAPTKKAKQPRTKNQEQGTPSGITTAHLRNFVQGQALPEALEKEVTQLASQYRFFHWHLAFPQVFDQGGFDCILGNPPWDSILFREEEFFASNRPEIANASTAAVRKRLIASLEHEAPSLFAAYLNGLREINAVNNFVRTSQRFPLCGVGRVNLFALFAECARTVVGDHGRVGQILPSGIATDDSTKLFFQAVIDDGQLVSFFDFENREAIFPSVHRSYKFSIVTLRGGRRTTGEAPANFVFFATRIDHLADPNRQFTLSGEEIATLNPETKTCPIFRTLSDAELTKAVYRRLSVLAKTDWSPELRRFLNSADDSRHFLTQAGEGLLPLYEGKYFHHYDHRWMTHDGREERQIDDPEKTDPFFYSHTRFWFSRSDATRRFGDNWKRSWTLAWRDITNATNERSFISTVVPSLAIPDTAKVLLVKDKVAQQLPSLIANMGSFAFDFVARQKIGGMHMSAFIVSQLPVVSVATYAQPCPWANDPKSEIPNPPSLRDWLLPRVLELTYTAWDLEAFASDCGWSGPPFRWDEERRFLLRCELDAAFFHLYLGPQSEWQQQPEALTRAFPTPRQAVSYIMDTFPIVKRKDETKHGHYRTQQTILQIYDALGESMQSGTPYRTLLTPPPADPACCHSARDAH
ncbi:MAG: N-6 DNA methylase [Verrucomicrobiaceae bacterium]|nr:N-6 DNA methylase [Verrucomicrobiaceae bacterium]